MNRMNNHQNSTKSEVLNTCADQHGHTDGKQVHTQGHITCFNAWGVDIDGTPSFGRSGHAWRQTFNHSRPFGRFRARVSKHKFAELGFHLRQCQLTLVQLVAQRTNTIHLSHVCHITDLLSVSLPRARNRGGAGVHHYLGHWLQWSDLFP
jgi:hypothetical protein